MRLLLIFLSLVSLLILNTLHTEVKIAKLTSTTNGFVTTSGLIIKGKMCNGECVKIIGANSTGWKTVTGNIVKKKGEKILFVRRIE